MTTILPVKISSFSLESGRNLSQMSIVKSVEAELNIESSPDIRAAITTENMSPRTPEGRIFRTTRGNAWFAQLADSPHCWKQSSPATQPRISGKMIRASIPGNTIIIAGRNFNNPARIEPPCECAKFLADKDRCTITWSVHQYQIEEKVWPKINGIHGISGSEFDRKSLKDASEGKFCAQISPDTLPAFLFADKKADCSSSDYEVPIFKKQGGLIFAF